MTVEWREKFYPQPPHLLPPGKGVTDDPVGATHWVIKNGMRFRATPSFSQKLSDTEIWQLSLLLQSANKIAGFSQGFAASAAATAATVRAAADTPAAAAIASRNPERGCQRQRAL